MTSVRTFKSPPFQRISGSEESHGKVTQSQGSSKQLSRKEQKEEAGHVDGETVSLRRGEHEEAEYVDEDPPQLWSICNVGSPW